MIDLHVHSTNSDGSKTVEELAVLAKQIGLHAIALTDHDTTSGNNDFANALDQSFVNFIPGVEISTSLEGKEQHILAYFIDSNNKKLNTLLSSIIESRNTRNDKIISKLNDLNYHITIKDVLDKPKGDAIARPHIAAALVKKGYFTTTQDVFNKLLHDEGPVFVPKELPTPEEVFPIIKEAGGISVWAHPLHRKKKNLNFEETLKLFLKQGLDGIEAYHSSYSYNQNMEILSIAKKYNIPISGGSDYHGAPKPDVNLGTGKSNVNVPNKVYKNLINYLKLKD